MVLKLKKDLQKKEIKYKMWVIKDTIKYLNFNDIYKNELF